jgi:preprotein translocase subunit YajC
MRKNPARGAFRLALLALVLGAVVLAGCIPAETTDTTTAGETAEGAEESSGTTNTILTIAMYAVVIGGLFYFLLIRPQRTRQKKQQDLMSSLAVGDEVQTIGGILGTIEYFDQETDTAVLQVEGGGKLRVARRALAGKVTPKAG